MPGLAPQAEERAPGVAPQAEERAPQVDQVRFIHVPVPPANEREGDRQAREDVNNDHDLRHLVFGVGDDQAHNVLLVNGFEYYIKSGRADLLINKVTSDLGRYLGKCNGLITTSVMNGLHHDVTDQICDLRDRYVATMVDSIDEYVKMEGDTEKMPCLMLAHSFQAREMRLRVRYNTLERAVMG